jgi:hypothetical protein
MTLGLRPVEPQTASVSMACYRFRFSTLRSSLAGRCAGNAGDNHHRYHSDATLVTSYHGKTYIGREGIMRARIAISLEVSDDKVFSDAIEVIETVLSYMADNVIVIDEMEGDEDWKEDDNA